VPNVAVVDLLMPGIGGVEAIRQLKRLSPSTQVIALTSYHEDEHIFPALRAGALSYVLKDVAAADLAETVRMAARGESVLHPRVAARVVEGLRGGRVKGHVSNILGKLHILDRTQAAVVAWEQGLVRRSDG
jgi:DNA-binding NarL/FixJ family response regulator